MEKEHEFIGTAQEGQGEIVGASVQHLEIDVNERIVDIHTQTVDDSPAQMEHCIEKVEQGNTLLKTLEIEKERELKKKRRDLEDIVKTQNKRIQKNNIIIKMQTKEKKELKKRNQRMQQRLQPAAVPDVQAPPNKEESKESVSMDINHSPCSSSLPPHLLPDNDESVGNHSFLLGSSSSTEISFMLRTDKDLFAYVPTEVLLYIFYMLPAKTLRLISTVHSSWAKCGAQALWEHYQTQTPHAIREGDLLQGLLTMFKNLPVESQVLDTLYIFKEYMRVLFEERVKESLLSYTERISQNFLTNDVKDM